MDEESPPGVRRPDLHVRAKRAARALCARFGAKVPDDVRSIVGYWQGCELALERAAQQVIAYASAKGVADASDAELPTPPPECGGGRP